MSQKNDMSLACRCAEDIVWQIRRREQYLGYTETRSKHLRNKVKKYLYQLNLCSILPLSIPRKLHLRKLPFVRFEHNLAGEYLLFRGKTSQVHLLARHNDKMPNLVWLPPYNHGAAEFQGFCKLGQVYVELQRYNTEGMPILKTDIFEPPMKNHYNNAASYNDIPWVYLMQNPKYGREQYFNRELKLTCSDIIMSKDNESKYSLRNMPHISTPDGIYYCSSAKSMSVSWLRSGNMKNLLEGKEWEYLRLLLQQNKLLIVNILLQICSAVISLHYCNYQSDGIEHMKMLMRDNPRLVHTDLKLENFLFTVYNPLNKIPIWTLTDTIQHSFKELINYKIYVELIDFEGLVEEGEELVGNATEGYLSPQQLTAFAALYINGRTNITPYKASCADDAWALGEVMRRIITTLEKMENTDECDSYNCWKHLHYIVNGLQHWNNSLRYTIKHTYCLLKKLQIEMRGNDTKKVAISSRMLTKEDKYSQADSEIHISTNNSSNCLVATNQTDTVNWYTDHVNCKFDGAMQQEIGLNNSTSSVHSPIQYISNNFEIIACNNESATTNGNIDIAAENCQKNYDNEACLNVKNEINNKFYNGLEVVSPPSIISNSINSSAINRAKSFEKSPERKVVSSTSKRLNFEYNQNIISLSPITYKSDTNKLTEMLCSSQSSKCTQNGLSSQCNLNSDSFKSVQITVMNNFITDKKKIGTLIEYIDDKLREVPCISKKLSSQNTQNCFLTTGNVIVNTYNIFARIFANLNTSRMNCHKIMSNCKIASECSSSIGNLLEVKDQQSIKKNIFKDGANILNDEKSCNTSNLDIINYKFNYNIDDAKLFNTLSTKRYRYLDLEDYYDYGCEVSTSAT